MSAQKAGKTVKSVENALNILQELRVSDGATVTELANRVGLTPGAVHTQLSTLRNSNIVKKDGTTYKLGPEVLLFGASFTNNHPLVRSGKGLIDELALETEEVANVHVERNYRIYKLYERFGRDATARSFHINKREQRCQFLHCTAAGKPILANLPPERIDRFLDEQELTEHTSDTITDKAALKDELEQIRKQGFALDQEEILNGIRGVGAFIRNEEQNVMGSVCVAGPSARFQGEYFEEELPELVTSVANRIEINLQTGDTEL